MDKPTILVVNPNTSDAMTVAIDRIAHAAAGASANVVTRRSLQGPHTIEGPLDAALGVAGMLEVVGAYPYSFDAVVVACFGDPGVDALRLLVCVPVPSHAALTKSEVEEAVDSALKAAAKQGIKGREVTPFLLSSLAKTTGGRSLEANRALLENNAGVAADISKAITPGAYV